MYRTIQLYMQPVRPLLSFLCLMALLLPGCGTLGGFENITFSTSKQNLKIGIDSLYAAYPQYRIPSKWESKDDWSARGYDFLESRLFYFKDSPEELYYVSFVGDSISFTDKSKVTVAVRAVANETPGWKLEKVIGSKERDRIELRFRTEIVEKLERITGSKAREGD